MNKLELFPVEGIGVLSRGDDLAGLIAERFQLEDGDVVVISSKAVSKTEGNVYTREKLSPSPFAHTLAERTNHDPWYCELVLRESADIVRMAPGVVISRTRHGFVMANAGVDASNAGGEGRLGRGAAGKHRAHGDADEQGGVDLLGEKGQADGDDGRHQRPEGGVGIGDQDGDQDGQGQDDHRCRRPNDPAGHIHAFLPPKKRLRPRRRRGPHPPCWEGTKKQP